MKAYKSIALSLAAVLLIAGCNSLKDFGDMNKSPNAPSTPFTSYLFTDAARYVSYFILGTATNGYDPWQQEWTGYLSESKNNQYGPLAITTSYSGSTQIYLYALKNLNYIIEFNEDEAIRDEAYVASFGTSANQIAAAKTLSAFYYMSLTDIYGPIVLSEAFKGSSEDNWTPKYDSQESVYTQLNDMLTESYRQFDESGSLNGSADVIYGGNIAKWKKFNASLRMLLAIKLCDVAPEVGKSRFAAAYGDGGMEDEADGFYYSYDDLNWNMLYYWCNPSYASAGLNAVPNYFIVEQMKEFEDNRMFEYFDIEGYRGSRDPSIFPRDQYTSFYGVPFGLISNDAVNAWTDCCASVNSKMLEMGATLPVITTARVLLTEAEAAWRGWISADPQALYEKGITVSFEQWGASGAAQYIKKPAIAYKGGDAALEQIAIQRWIAGYLSDGVEAWSDWRRLDIPYMPVGPGAATVGNEHYPYRLGYNTSYDSAYNAENYAAALAQISSGKDDTDGRVWWDVAPNRMGVLPDDVLEPSVQIPADWQPVMSGTYYYLGGGSANDEPLGEGLFGMDSIETTLYQDANHPDAYKFSPWGDGSVELFLNWDAASSTYFVPNQIVGTYGGYAINVADRDTDQGTDNNYRGEWDPEDGCLWIYMMYRADGPRGSSDNALLINYGYDVFEPAE